MRFHPNSQASTDHAPGPIIARPAPSAANNMQIHRWSACVRTLRSSTSVARLPAMGVHRPTSKRIAVPAPNTPNMVDCSECPISDRTIAWSSSATPATRRNNRRPAPGQPRANDENSRLKKGSYRPQPSIRLGTLKNCMFHDGSNTPKRREFSHSLE